MVHVMVVIKWEKFDWYTYVISYIAMQYLRVWVTSDIVYYVNTYVWG